MQFLRAEKSRRPKTQGFRVKSVISDPVTLIYEQIPGRIALAFSRCAGVCGESRSLLASRRAALNFAIGTSP